MSPQIYREVRPMEDFITLFKSNPFAAIGMVLLGGSWWWIKNNQEKTVDNREVLRLTTALDISNKRADDAEDRADAAFAKQLELTQTFSDMRSQNARLESKLEQVSDQLSKMANDNADLREQVNTLTTQNRDLSNQVNRLQRTIDSGTTQ